MVVRRGRSQSPRWAAAAVPVPKGRGWWGRDRGQALESAGNLLVTAPGLGTEVLIEDTRAGMLRQLSSRVLTSTCGEGGRQNAPRVEVSDVLPSSCVGEGERLAIICEFCLARAGNLAARCSTRTPPRRLPLALEVRPLELAVLRWPESGLTLPLLLSESMSVRCRSEPLATLMGMGWRSPGASWSRAWRSGSG